MPLARREPAASGEGCLARGYRGTWQWTRDGERVAWIGIASDGAFLTLDYRTRDGWEADWTDVTETIPIERAPCRYGGARPWFRCPGVVNGRHCGRRVGKLFIGGRYALCRHCYRISYTSQSETRMERLYRKADKARMALGGVPGMAPYLPDKPKGMWWRTYRRRIEHIGETEMRADIEFEAVAGRWLDQLNPTWRERHR